MAKPTRLPDWDQQELLNGLRVQVAAPEQLPRIEQLLDKHHYLKSLRPVGERLYYIVTVRRSRLTLRPAGLAGWRGETTIISIPHDPATPHSQRESWDSQRTPAQRALAAGLRRKT